MVVLGGGAAGPLIFVHFDNQGLGHGLSNHHQSFPMNVEMEEESIGEEKEGPKSSMEDRQMDLCQIHEKKLLCILESSRITYYLLFKASFVLMPFKKLVSFLREMNFFELKV